CASELGHYAMDYW
nr:immunoglobulin heavy chain junction region [Mus musculus]